MEPYIGQIAIFGFNYAPPGWEFCQGQLLPIVRNTQLFSVIRNTYGGNGQTTFALPNLQGVPVGAGQGQPSEPGQEPSNHNLGQAGGEVAVTLTPPQMPSHTHAFNVLTAQATSSSPEGNQLARAWQAQEKTDNVVSFYSSNPRYAQIALTPDALSTAGSGQPHNNLQPYLTLNFCIAVQGIFPLPGQGPGPPMQRDAFIGELSICAFGKAPAGWAVCDGQMLSVQQYQALFSLLGTTYGGNGKTTFALPDLRGRVPLNVGANFQLGQSGGEESHGLSPAEMPAHTHSLMVDGYSTSVGNAPSPAMVLGRSVGAVVPGDMPFTASLYGSTYSNVRLAGPAIGLAGGGQPHLNMMPSLALNFCINLNGVYPSR